MGKKILAIIVVLGLCLGLWLFLGVRGILVYESSEVSTPVDAIVVLGGSRGSRVEYAVKMYKQLQPKYMVFTGAPYYDFSEPALMQDYALNRGVPKSVIVLETQSQSTLDHPHYLEPILHDRQITSILVITSQYHTRRSYRVFRRYFKRNNIPIKVSISGSPDGIDYKAWWRHHEMIEAVGFELIKTLYYLWL